MGRTFWDSDMGGIKYFTPTQLTASDVNEYLMNQSVMVFASSAARANALTAPTEGMVTYLQDTDQLEVYDGTAWNRFRPATAPTLRNLLINGDFRVTQRETVHNSSSVYYPNNDGGYTLDRWLLLSDGNNIVSVTQSTDAPYGTWTSGELNVVTANKKFGLAQIVEWRDTYQVQNKTVTLSFDARCVGSSISNVKAAILSWTGTADTFTAGQRDFVSAWNGDGVTPSFVSGWTLENTPVNLNVTTTFANYSVSAAIDTGYMTNLAIFIWSDDLTTTVSDKLRITNVQLEVGTYATPFERRPMGIELPLCQRYFTNMASGELSGSFYAGTASMLFGFFPVQMRVTPAVGIPPAPWTNSLLDYGVAFRTPSNLQVNAITPTCLTIVAYNGYSATYIPTTWYGGRFVASAEM